MLWNISFIFLRNQFCSCNESVECDLYELWTQALKRQCVCQPIINFRQNIITSESLESWECAWNKYLRNLILEYSTNVRGSPFVLEPALDTGRLEWLSKCLQVKQDCGRSREKAYNSLMLHKYWLECASWLASKYLTGKPNGSFHGILARRISFCFFASWPGSPVSEAPRRLPFSSFGIATRKNCS